MGGLNSLFVVVETTSLHPVLNASTPTPTQPLSLLSSHAPRVFLFGPRRPFLFPSASVMLPSSENYAKTITTANAHSRLAREAIVVSNLTTLT